MPATSPAASSVCIAAGKQMIEQDGGKIINISSIAGTKGNPGMLITALLVLAVGAEDGACLKER